MYALNNARATLTSLALFFRFVIVEKAAVKFNLLLVKCEYLVH